MTSFVLPGDAVVSSAAEEMPEQLNGLLEVTEIHETWLGSDRSAAAASGRTDVGELADNDIVEIRLEGGLKLWQSVANTRADFAGSERSVSDQGLLVPRTIRMAAATGARDGAGYAVEGVKVFKTSLADKVAGKAGEMTALKVAEYIEGKLDLGFWRCKRVDTGEGPEIVRDKAKITAADGKKPILVLVHGTFSSTMGSFSDLVETPDAQSDLWAMLEQAFAGGIYALEHRSVTQSPIQNALDLVTALPKGAKLSMLSHSRGGIVTELIARGARVDVETGKLTGGKLTGGEPFDAMDEAIFAGDRDNGALLKQLSKAIAEKDITVERVIRIAGPLGGTALASKRLDRVLSIALNALELFPAVKASVAYDLFKSFLMGFVKSKESILPGLEAMMPSSPLIQLLNQADVMSNGTLHVVTGDNEGKGIFRRLRNLAVDLFFGSDNDFVVNTPSMSRGLARATAPVTTPIVSQDITHFGYFRDKAARNAIRAAASSAAPGVVKANAGESLMTESGLRRINVSRARDAGTLPVCFYLPGIMGSHLRHDGKWIWSNPFRMATGGLKRLRMPDADPNDVAPDEMMEKYYGDLAKYLSRSHDVVLFPYDWRKSVLTTGADVLATKVRRALSETDKPIRFLAHSMGGLVVRAFIDAHPGLWAQVKSRRGSRFVMLGTPNGGAFSMAHTMMGRAKAIRQLAVLDVTQSQRQLLEIVTSMAGPAQLLPSDAEGHYLKKSTWEDLRRLDSSPEWVVPGKRVLDASRAAHDVFARQRLDPDLVCYVAGLGEEVTPSGIRVDQAADGAKKVTFVGTRKGDGTVTWATGIPPGIEPYYMRAVHGDMARTASAFPAIFDLLDKGQTGSLSKSAPAVASRSDAPETVEMREDALEIYPGPDEVMDSLMGSGAPGAGIAADAPPRTNVTMRHGDLRFTSHPVLVGHYMGDPVDGAEGALDGCLDGSLSDVRDLGLYPGAIETCEVFLRRGRNPCGAVVAGLGRFGDLTPGQLRKTVNRAVLRYALTLRRRAAEDDIAPEDMAPINLTTLVIGHKGANMTVQQSVQSILEAVADANLTLKETPIANLEFVELFEDTAFRAASALNSAGQTGPMASQFEFARQIKSGDGALLRIDYGLESSAWQRITVARCEGDDGQTGALKFTVIADGAKANFRKTAVQTEVIDRLLDESRKGTATDRSLGQLLFQLMIPLELKAFAQNDQKIQLILDDKTAAIPWELMEDSVSVFGDGLYQSTGDTDFRPLVVRTPVLRQLVSPGAVVPRASSNKVLVVGDPKSSLPMLRGAEREARQVAHWFGEDGGYAVTSLIRPENGITVLNEVMLTPHKIMHFAAHGVYEAKDQFVKAGLVLSDGVSLTSAELGNMEYVPEFVFLNCCHIGRIEENTGPIAADLSRTLIKKGVRAVIAAGWAVDDAAADLFASEFYKRMLGGAAFGDAVHRARVVVFDRHPETNTWGAYQCYGDPDYHFDERRDDADGPDESRTYYSSAHAQKAAINIERDVGRPHRPRAALIAELDALVAGANPDWLADADWCEAMGRAYAGLDVFAPAIEMLERAKANHRSTVTVHAIELLEHLKVRSATYEWSKAESAVEGLTGEARKAAKGKARDKRNAQKAAVKAALDRLDGLDEIVGARGKPARNERRELLKGTVCKRKVLTASTKATREKALIEMIGYYENAMHLAAKDDPNRLKPHPAFNWLSGHVILGSKKIKGQSYEALFDQVVAQNNIRENSFPSFWSAVLDAEIDILRGMLAKPKERGEIFKRFEDRFRYAWKRGGSYDKARSIREHVHFLKSMARTDAQRAWVTRIQSFLNDLTWTYRDAPRDEF